MDIKQTEHLLKKYYEGLTTLAEERMLQEYFTETQEIPAELVTSKQQFMLYKTAAEARLNAEKLELRIAALIDNQATITLEPVHQRKPMYRILAAATIALLIGVSGLFIYLGQKNSPKDTFTDPMIAYNEAQKALLYVSQKMNKGMEPLSHVSKINTGTDKLKSLEKMDESLGMLNLVSFINRSSNLKK